MTPIRFLAAIGVLALATGLEGAAQRKPEQPWLEFGGAKISLGMTIEQVQEQLSGAGWHIQILADKKTAMVDRNADSGQVRFSDGRAIYAEYQMPEVQSADELAQEIAGAVDSMETKTCAASNSSSHGTGGGVSQSIFECGPRSFNIQTLEVFGSSRRTVNVNIQIGHTATN